MKYFTAEAPDKSAPWAWGENSTFKRSFDLENVCMSKSEKDRVEFQNAISIQSHHLSYRIITIAIFFF